MAQSLMAKPVEPNFDGAVVRWSKWGAGTADARVDYTYASIRTPDGVWYTTQDPRRTGGNKILPLFWEELLAKIGEKNWNTLELLT